MSLWDLANHFFPVLVRWTTWTAYPSWFLPPQIWGKKVRDHQRGSFSLSNQLQLFRCMHQVCFPPVKCRKYTHHKPQGWFIFEVGMLDFHLGGLVGFHCPISWSLLQFMPKMAGRPVSSTQQHWCTRDHQDTFHFGTSHTSTTSHASSAEQCTHSAFFWASATLWPLVYVGTAQYQEHASIFGLGIGDGCEWPQLSHHPG